MVAAILAALAGCSRWQVGFYGQVSVASGMRRSISCVFPLFLFDRNKRFFTLAREPGKHVRFDQPNSFWDQGYWDQPDLPDNLNIRIKPTTMRKLSRFLENPLDDDGISIDELTAFTTDHLQRMIANNSGGFLTARIAATQTGLDGVEDTLTDDQTKLGMRKGRKIAKNGFRAALPEGVARIHGVVVAKYGPNSAEVAECFPEGRTVFGKCTDDRVDNHLQTLINGVTAHEVDLGAAVVTDATSLLTAWNAIYTASESSTGAKTSTQDQKNAARAALQLELFKNLLTIALQFPRQPEKLALYMQQSLLEDHPAQPPEPTPPPTP
jgi:hypothetical protein